MQGLPQTPPSVSETSNHARTSSPTLIATTEGRPQITQGQVTNGQVLSSEPLAAGQGHRVQVQLSNGEQVNLITDKPLPEGQLLQLTGRAEGQVEVRVLSQAAIQQAANNLISQIPPLKVQLATGQTLSLLPGQAARAEVLASQPAANGQGYNLRLQLANGQQINLTSERPLPVASQVHLSHSLKGDLEVRSLNPAAIQLLDQLKAPLTAIPSSSTKPNAPAPASLQTLLASASAQLRQALPRQAPLIQPMQQLSQLVRQLAPSNPQQVSNTSQVNTPATSNPTARGAEQAAANQATANNPPASATPSTTQLLVTLGSQLTAALKLVPQGNQTPSATSLQQFIPFSGLLLEANILRGVQTNPANGDLKLLLQQASSLLRQGMVTSNNTSTPRQQQLLQQLAQQVQTAESRIQVLQQTSLQATQATHERGQPAQVIQMDLPYSVRGEWFQAQLEIRRWIEEKDAEAALEEMAQKTRSWEINLSFTLEDWGKIHTLLRLKDENLKADIWVETESSYSPIKNQAELLAARLRRIGAEVEEVTCHLGEPPTLARTGGHQQIIDTRI